MNLEFGFQTPQKNLKFHSASPREISNFSVVFEPNSKFYSPQKDVFARNFFSGVTAFWWLGLRLVEFGLFSWLPAPLEIHDSAIMKVVKIISEGGMSTLMRCFLLQCIASGKCTMSRPYRPPGIHIYLVTFLTTVFHVKETPYIIII